MKTLLRRHRICAAGAALAVLAGPASAEAPRCTSDFVQSVGVNTHIEATDTQYRDLPRVIRSLDYLGVGNIRDAAPRSPQGLAAYKALIAVRDRIRLDLIVMGDPRRLMPAIESLAPHVRAVEGPNEVDRTPVRFEGRSGTEAVAANQALIHDAVTNSPALNVPNGPGGGTRVPVLNFSLANQNKFTEFGDLSANADIANVHAYARKGVPPFWMLQPTIRKVQATLDRPVVVTESDYPTLLQPDGNGVSEAVQSKWVLAILLGNFRNGVLATYIYQLLDGAPDPSGREFEAHFGLFRSDWTPKPAATGLRNLLLLLHGDEAQGEGGPCRKPAAPVRYHADLPHHAFDLLMRRPDGSSVLVLWAEPAIWNAGSNQDMPAPRIATAVLFEGTVHDVRVYDPLAGAEPIGEYQATERVAVGLTDRPILISFR